MCNVFCWPYFDILNVGRCAPNQSYINAAERCMSLLDMDLQGFPLQKDHAGKSEKMLTSCKTMKSIREKAQHQQELKEAHMASIENARKEIENSFSILELKGKKVKAFLPTGNSKEVVDALKDIDLTIRADQLIPHSRSKLKNFSSLQRYFDKHLTEGLYLLQFGECDCTIKNDPLPPLKTSPVMAPDGPNN